MNQYVLKLSPATYKWMKNQPPVVRRVLGNIIATHFTAQETSFITSSDILDYFLKLTNGADPGPACEALDNLFDYNSVGYVEGSV